MTIDGMINTMQTFINDPIGGKYEVAALLLACRVAIPILREAKERADIYDQLFCPKCGSSDVDYDEHLSDPAYCEACEHLFRVKLWYQARRAYE